MDESRGLRRAYSGQKKRYRHVSVVVHALDLLAHHALSYKPGGTSGGALAYRIRVSVMFTF
ncbi:hypothetical protein [Alicyclobacillus dauci]|uniref:Uncharacterized protein n=1 Tax=Alicyclobacillus dauci TaxID=1475485 RepID=A0ABY6Z1T2_9BACL|nr:hypothetical protein [Alicyclobacillus dauci]WAH36852.1 hypothetical protein NZD86_22225 [Alicyclobacillus dauci]